MTEITRSISQLTYSDRVTDIASSLANTLGVAKIDISEHRGEITYTALSDTGLILGETNYIPNATGQGREIIFARRSGLFLASDVAQILTRITLLINA